MSIFYCSRDGNDNASGKSDTAAWRYLATGAQRLQAGDTLRLVEGEYNDWNDRFDTQDYHLPSGESWERAITIEAMAGHRVTLRPPNIHAIRLTYGAGGTVGYWQFRDLFLDGSSMTDQGEGSPELLYTSSGVHHCRFERLKIAHAMGCGLQYSISNVPAPGPYSTFHEMIDCELWDVGNSMVDSGHGGLGINNGYLSYTQTDDNLWLRCWFHDTVASGTVCYGSRNRWVSNWWERCGLRGGPAYAHTFGSSSHVDSNGQTIFNDDNAFENNVVQDNGNGGLLIYSNTRGTKANHNTFLRNKTFAVMCQYIAGSADVHNNIMLDHDVPLYVVDEGADVRQSGNFTEGDPQFVLSTEWDYRLKESSPCRDAGADVGVKEDYFGNPRDKKPDIGAAEYIEGTDPGPDPEPPPTDEDKKFHVDGEVTVGADGSVDFTGSISPAATKSRRRGVVRRQ